MGTKAQEPAHAYSDFFAVPPPEHAPPHGQQRGLIVTSVTRSSTPAETAKETFCKTLEILLRKWWFSLSLSCTSTGQSRVLFHRHNRALFGCFVFRWICFKVISDKTSFFSIQCLALKTHQSFEIIFPGLRLAWNRVCMKERQRSCDPMILWIGCIINNFGAL